MRFADYVTMRNEYSNSRDYWAAYVDKTGGMIAVSQKLGIPYPTIACICNGSRGIGRSLAKRMSDADPSLDPGVLIWVEATKPDAEARDVA